MVKHDNHLMSITHWGEVREDVEKINKPLCGVIDNISPDDTYQILKVRYPYGSLILDQDRLCLPDKNNNFHPIDSPNIDSGLSKILSHENTPLMLQRVPFATLCDSIIHP